MLQDFILFLFSLCVGAFATYRVLKILAWSFYEKDFTEDNRMETEHFKLMQANELLKSKLKIVEKQLQQVKKENDFLFKEIMEKSA